MARKVDMALYHNLGDGKFEDVTKKAGLDPTVHAIGCTAGDYDNDGEVDLAFSDGGRIYLFHNEKDGTFKNDGTFNAPAIDAGIANPKGQNKTLPLAFYTGSDIY